VSRTSLWHDIETFISSQETFYGVCAPRFDIGCDMGIVDMFHKVFDLTVT
jgi:hypothetical protein